MRSAFVGCVSESNVHICSISMGHRNPFKYFIVHTSSFHRFATREPVWERRDECALAPKEPIGWAFIISAAVFATRFDRYSTQPSEKCDAFRLRFCAPGFSFSFGCR